MKKGFPYLLYILCTACLLAACSAPEPSGIPKIPSTPEPTAVTLSTVRPAQGAEERKTFLLTANPDKDPFTASTAIGEIEFTTMQPPTGIEIWSAISTPHGLAAIFRGEGGGICWSTTGEVWECTPTSPSLRGIFSSGDYLYVHSYQGFTRYSWVGEGWVKETHIDILPHIDRFVFSPHGALAANGITIMYSHDGLHFKESKQIPKVDFLPKAERKNCVCGYEIEPVNLFGPLLLVTEEGFLALTPSHPDYWDQGCICEPLLWFSQDGNEWSLISKESPFGKSSYVNKIFQIEGRFVALGGQSKQGGMIWFSNDGRRWDKANVLTDGSIDIAVSEMGWVLTGASSFWVSKDRVDWHGPYTLPNDLMTAWFLPSVAIWSDRIFGAGVKNPVLGKVTIP